MEKLGFDGIQMYGMVDGFVYLYSPVYNDRNPILLGYMEYSSVIICVRSIRILEVTEGPYISSLTLASVTVHTGPLGFFATTPQACFCETT